MGIILSFILPILTWLITFPLKILLKVAERGVKHSSKFALKQSKKLIKKENTLKTMKNLQKVGKFAYMSAKFGYQLGKFGLKTGVFLMKWLVRLLDILLQVIAWLSGIFFALITNVVGVAVIGAIVVSLIVVSQDLDLGGGGSKTTQKAPTPIGGADYMSLDWGQDFSSQLKAIEDKHGLEARNWVEMTIIAMNTAKSMLEDGSAQYLLPGTMTGIKGIETGQSSLSSSRDLTNQTVTYGSGNLNTPMQFDTSWQKRNPYYTTFNRDSGGSAYYYPDAFYGIMTKFNELTVNGYSPKRTNPLIDKAFETMGVEQTPEKLNFVRYAGLTTNAYATVYLENYATSPRLSKEQTNDTVYVNAILLIAFGEEYGYTITENVDALTKSMYKNIKGDEYSNWFIPKDSMAYSIYGIKGSAVSYPSQVEVDRESGVLDGNGSPVTKTLFGHLLDVMPTKAKDDVWNSKGLKGFHSTKSHHWRAKYDLTTYLMGAYDVWWASKELGLIVERDNVEIGDSSNDEDSE